MTILKQGVKQALVSSLKIVSQKAALFASEVQQIDTLEEVEILISEFPEAIAVIKQLLQQSQKTKIEEISGLIEDLQLNIAQEKLNLNPEVI